MYKDDRCNVRRGETAIMADCESTKYSDTFKETRTCEKRKNHGGYHKSVYEVW